MQKLPESLSIEKLMSQHLPGDIQLGEVKNYLRQQSWFMELARMSKIAHGDTTRITISFWIGKDEAPDSMTIGHWQVQPGARVSLDDGSGGMKVSEHA